MVQPPTSLPGATRSPGLHAHRFRPCVTAFQAAVPNGSVCTSGKRRLKWQKKGVVLLTKSRFYMVLLATKSIYGIYIYYIGFTDKNVSFAERTYKFCWQKDTQSRFGRVKLEESPAKISWDLLGPGRGPRAFRADAEPSKRRPGCWGWGIHQFHREWMAILWPCYLEKIHLLAMIWLFW